MPLILGTNSIKDTGFNVDNSLRFDGASSSYLEITPSSSGNRKTFTISFWVKKCELASNPDTMSDAQMLFGGQQSGYPAFNIIFLHTNDTIFLKDAQASNNIQISIKSDLKFRDPSAWYHVVFAIDTTQSTASNRAKLYVNGVQQTDLAGENATGGASDDPLYPNQNQDLQFNGNEAHYINKYSSNYEDMYMAEFVFIDGQALDPTSFGEFDSDTNIWKPIDVSGLTFGTNGFYLDFENSSSLGADVSGNGNNFTVSNLTSINQTTDTCTNNFATINPLDNFYFNANYIRDGNLHVRSDGSSYSFIRATFGVSTGKWYWEVEFDAQQQGAYSIIGIESKEPTSSTQGVGDTTNGYGYYADNGNVRTNNGNVGGWSGSTYAVGDIIGVALDLDNNKLYFSKNGTFQNSGDPTSGSTGTGAVSITAPSSTSSGFYFPAVTFYDATGKGTFKFNFGNPIETISSGNSDGNGYGNFEYSVPSGYYSLCTKNLSEFG